MSDPSLELQIALVERLKNNAGAAGARVHDVPPPKPAYPYVTLGECQVLPDKADCIDGVEAYPVIHAWSREVGFTEVKGIAKAIVATLDDQPLQVAGYTVVVFEFASVHYIRDPDGETSHAAITFRSLIQLA